jgi:antitoxin component YwqK of YwqJK toxin-antitoxin module
MQASLPRPETPSQVIRIGSKQSEATIVGGKLNGAFRRWHENGQLAEQIELRDDLPHGESLAYFPSGCLKARVRLADGKVLATENFKDGEVQAPPVVAAAEAAKPKS